MKEQWRKVPGYNGSYSASDLGRVRLDVNRHNKKRGSILKQTPVKDGYLAVMLRASGKSRQVCERVNRLIVLVFLGPIPPGMQANHINGDITNNRLINLEVVTPQQNVAHSIHQLGHRRDGEHNPAAKLTEAQVVQLRELADSGATYEALGRKFGITASMAGLIVRGKLWQDTGGPIIERRSKQYTQLTDDEAKAIMEAARRGESITALARQHGLSKRTIYNWLQGKSRKLSS